MTQNSIYNDIKARTGGEIYIGVVGPVRTGKSTFIKRFMESLVLPNIEDEFVRQRALDEMPQSSGGRTVMTTEPKFIPEEAVEISVGENISLSVKMVDCVGYVVPQALGQSEDGKQRLVNTPWFDEPIPFTEAAKIGTDKVIGEHSTIGLVVSTDGSIGEIERSSYVDAEEKVIAQMKNTGKPFALIINSATPENEESISLASELELKYQVPVALINALKLDSEDIGNIMQLVLSEFPVSEVSIELPGWVLALERNHWVFAGICDDVLKLATEVEKVSDIQGAFEKLTENEYVSSVYIDEINLSNGKAKIAVNLEDGLYFKVISELTGLDVANEEMLISTLSELSAVKKKYDRLENALEEVERTGYGIVTPEIEDLNFQEPTIIKQSNGYGVKLRANAPSLHIIKANIETEINPVVGTEQQSQDLIKYLLNEYEESPEKIWESNIFGKSMHQLVSEGLNSKLENMPLDAREKMSDTLEKIINEGSSGLICILL